MRKIAEIMVVLGVLAMVDGCLFQNQAKQDPPMTVAKRAADSLPAASKGIAASTDKIEGAAKEAQPKAPDQAKVILGEVPVLRGIADAISKLAATLDKAIGDELAKDKAQIDALNKQIADLKSEAERSMTATFRIGIVISLIFIAISVYMTIQGFVSWALTATFTVMLAVLLALMRYEKIVAGIGLGIVCFVVVVALGCIVYEVVKAHGSLSTALADAKADLAKAEATIESLVTAAKKAV